MPFNRAPVPLRRLEVPKKTKKSHGTVKAFEQMLDVHQKVLRDAFEWFCSVYLASTEDASASAIIEPYTSTIKQVTLILKCEELSPHSRFKSVVVRQKFTMTLDKNLQKANEALGTNQALSESFESIECLDCFDVEGVDIAIFKPIGEMDNEKNPGFLENAMRLVDHIQRFYTKNHFHWITGDNSALVLAKAKRHGNVSCIFPTHFKKFEKSEFRGKVNVNIRQEPMQIDLLDENLSLPEVTRHAKLFNKHRELRQFCQLQQMFTPKYLEGGDNWVRCEAEESYPFFSDESSDSDEEYYIVAEDNVQEKVHDRSISLEDFLIVNSLGDLVPFSSSTIPKNGEDNLDAEESKYSSSTSEFLQIGEKESENFKSTIDILNEIHGTASKEEDNMAKGSRCSSSTSEDFQPEEEESKNFESTIEILNQLRDAALKKGYNIAKGSRYSSLASEAFRPEKEENECLSTMEIFKKLKAAISKNRNSSEGQEKVDSTSKGDESQIKGENVSSNESKIEESSKTVERDFEIPSSPIAFNSYPSDSESNLDEAELREIELVHSCDETNFFYFLLLFDREHGTIYRKSILEKVVDKHKVIGYNIKIAGNKIQAFIAYDRSIERTNAFLEIHKYLFKPRPTSFLEKANVGMAKLKRKLKLKPTKSPQGGSPKKEGGGERSRKLSEEGKKFFSIFARKDDWKVRGPKKNLTFNDTSSEDSELD